MFRAAVVTPWVAEADDPSEKPSNHPLVADEYVLSKWDDCTGQPAQNIPPAPNEYTICVEAEEDVIAAIEADTDYTVLWSEEIVEAGP